MRTKSWEFPQFHWQSVYQPVAPSMSSGPLSILTVKKPPCRSVPRLDLPDRTVFGEDDRTQSVPFMLFRFKDGGFQRMGLGIDNQQSVFLVDSKNPVSNSDHRTDLSTVQTAGSILSPGNSLPDFHLVNIIQENTVAGSYIPVCSSTPRKERPSESPILVNSFSTFIVFASITARRLPITVAPGSFSCLETI